MNENGKLGLLIGLCGILGLIWAIRGCGGYGEVGPKTYEYAKALYSICNRQDADRLDEFAASLKKSHEAGDVRDQEHAWLDEIIQTAQAEEWEEATAMARRLMEDQVEGGP